MLIRDTVDYQYEAQVMTDTAIITALAKTSLQEVAKQSQALGTGLLNAAPGDKAGAPNNSVLYLLETAEALNKIAEECDKVLE